MPLTHTLSKSTFVQGCQCEKALWLSRHQRQLRGAVSAKQQAIFDRGTSVGMLAQQLFPGGVDASPENYFEYPKSVELTRQLIADGQKVIYEAAFQHEGVLAALDILVNDYGVWKGYEVKSSTSVRTAHVTDAALQYHVLAGQGIGLGDISVVHLNPAYVRSGELDVQKLFTVVSVHKLVLEKQDFIRKQVVRLKEVLALPEAPEKSIGEHCSDPYDCDFMGHCWNHIPNPSVFDLANLRNKKAFELYHQGIVRYEDISPDIELTAHQRLQITAHLANTTHIDREAIRVFLQGITYPLYFLDFETFNPGIPLYDQSRPYQQIPFQYSIHYKNSPNRELRHTDFLAEPNGDPRPAFIENLLDKTRLPGTILCYNQNFEILRLKELARDFPRYKAELEQRISRVRDLMTPFQQRLYYAPGMNGSYSIKAVLPALVPELSYDDLAISEGSDASLYFEQLIYDLHADKEEIRKNLLDYCRIDTLAMVRVVERLEQI